MKYADEEAEAYYKKQEEDERTRAEQRAKRQTQKQPRANTGHEMRRNDNNRRHGAPHDQVESLDQVKKSTGINFGGERPTFTRTKPKQEAVASVDASASGQQKEVELSSHPKQANHRTVIDQTKNAANATTADRPPRDHKDKPKHNNQQQPQQHVARTEADLEKEYLQDREKYPQDYDEQYDKLPSGEKPEGGSHRGGKRGARKERGNGEAKAEGEESKEGAGERKPARKNNRTRGGKGRYNEGGERRAEGQAEGEGWPAQQEGGARQKMVYKKVKKVEGGEGGLKGGE